MAALVNIVLLAWIRIVAADVSAPSDAGPIRGLSGADHLETTIARASDDVERSRRAGDSIGLTEALIARAEAYQANSELLRARNDLIEALAVARSSQNARAIARANGSLGGFLLFSGERSTALPHIEESLQLAREQRDNAAEAASLVNLGNYYAHPTVQLSDRAIKEYTEAIRLAERTGLYAIAARAALNQVRAALIDRDQRNIVLGFRKALSLIEQISGQAERAPLLLAAAELRLELSDLPLPNDLATRGAGDLFTAAEGAARIARLPQTNAAALGGLAAITEAGGDDHRALELTQAARRLANPQRDPDLAFQLALREARLQVRMGDRRGANSQYAEALKLASLISIDPGATDAADRARRFRERVSPAFLEYAALLLDSARAEADGAQQQMTLRTVRRTIEQLKTAELTNYFQDPCFAARGDRTRPPQSANAHTAVLYPIAFGDRLTILISIADVLSAESIQIPRADVVRTVNAFRSAAQHRRDDRSIATRSYDLLLRPVLHRLNDAAIDTLVFVPDSELRLLPWAALFDGQGFVGERYAIAIVPGIELVDTAPVRRPPIRPLICGVTRPTMGFPSLPYISQEINNIRGLYGGVLLQDEACRFDMVRQSLAQNEFSVLHIASHSQFATSNQDTFLLTFNEQISMNDLERLIKPSRFRDQPMDLVVLSGCETAAGDDRAAIGFAGAALKAGARSALATLWNVDDAASADLVTSFYQNLGDADLTKAQALQRAQEHLRSRAETRDPYYWAGFVIIGNWL
jgi:CHAT domain-containing protein